MSIWWYLLVEIWCKLDLNGLLSGRLCCVKDKIGICEGGVVYVFCWGFCRCVVYESVLCYKIIWLLLWWRCIFWVSIFFLWVCVYFIVIRFCYVNNVVIGVLYGIYWFNFLWFVLDWCCVRLFLVWYWLCDYYWFWFLLW